MAFAYGLRPWVVTHGGHGLRRGWAFRRRRAVPADLRPVAGLRRLGRAVRPASTRLLALGLKRRRRLRRACSTSATRPSSPSAAYTTAFAGLVGARHPTCPSGCSIFVGPRRWRLCSAPSSAAPHPAPAAATTWPSSPLGFGEIVPDAAKNNLFGRHRRPQRHLRRRPRPAFPTHGHPSFEFGLFGANPAAPTTGRSSSWWRSSWCCCATWSDHGPGPRLGGHPRGRGGRRPPPASTTVATKLLAFAIGASVFGLRRRLPSGAMLGTVTPDKLRVRGVSVTRADHGSSWGGIGKHHRASSSAQCWSAFVIFWVLPGMQEWMGNAGQHRGHQRPEQHPSTATTSFIVYGLILIGHHAAATIGACLAQPCPQGPSWRPAPSPSPLASVREVGLMALLEGRPHRQSASAALLAVSDVQLRGRPRARSCP